MPSEVDAWDHSPAAEAARRAETAMVDAYRAMKAHDPASAETAAQASEKAYGDTAGARRLEGFGLRQVLDNRNANFMQVDAARTRHGLATRNERQAREFARRARLYADAAKNGDDTATL